jgi:hypothetical protein
MWIKPIQFSIIASKVNSEIMQLIIMMHCFSLRNFRIRLDYGLH